VNLVGYRNISIIDFRLAVFSYGSRIHTDFIQDKNAVDCLACSSIVDIGYFYSTQ
jgi:hypothetical protein